MDNDPDFWRTFDAALAAGHSRGEAAIIAGKAQAPIVKQAAPPMRAPAPAPAAPSPREPMSAYESAMREKYSAAELARPASREHLYTLVGITVDGLQDLAARIATLEQKADAYKGVWKGSRVYERGSFVTDRGSLWHCERPNAARPGSDEAQGAWKLAGKAGKWLMKESRND